jgi:hypothetical protein
MKERVILATHHIFIDRARFSVFGPVPKSDVPMEVISADVFGPVTPPTPRGSRFGLTILFFLSCHHLLVSNRLNCAFINPHAIQPCLRDLGNFASTAAAAFVHKAAGVASASLVPDKLCFAAIGSRSRKASEQRVNAN